MQEDEIVNLDELPKIQESPELILKLVDLIFFGVAETMPPS